MEEDHDPVYSVEESSSGLRLGSEVPESDVDGCRITTQIYRAELHPETSSISVVDLVNLDLNHTRRAPVFRLNDGYRFVPGEVVEETDRRFVVPNQDAIVRAGSLLIPWTKDPSRRYRFSYSSALPASDEDEIVQDAAYVTAWWLPSLGRLPFRVQATIGAPANWTVRAEGFRLGEKLAGNRRVSSFRSDLPISYPKVIGGRYVRVANATASNGDSFSVYQLHPTDAARAAKELKNMMAAASFYSRALAPLPFHGYECYEADRYYGIESYSHTVLRKDLTHFISHEMGHTYFGGMAPCPYVRDSWNEGVTEYVDSVLLLHDADHSLENGSRTLDIPVPLSQMPVPWALGGATYWRGCYVMKMLESEIGADRVLAALRKIATSRKGRDTCWDDLRPYFEQAGGKPLGWFWRQWIDGASFPTLSLDSQRTARCAGGFRTTVRVSQTGTKSPFRLRFGLAARSFTKQVQMTAASAKFTFETPSRPLDLRLQVFPFTLARVSAVGVANYDHKSIRPY